MPQHQNPDAVAREESRRQAIAEAAAADREARYTNLYNFFDDGAPADIPGEPFGPLSRVNYFEAGPDGNVEIHPWTRNISDGRAIRVDYDGETWRLGLYPDSDGVIEDDVIPFDLGSDTEAAARAIIATVAFVGWLR